MPHIDQNVPRTFFDPHPGFLGAAIPIPSPIKAVADALAGQTLPLREALQRLKDVGIGEIELHADQGWIALRLDGGARYASHLFRVIRFR